MKPGRVNLHPLCNGRSSTEVVFLTAKLARKRKEKPWRAFAPFAVKKESVMIAESRKETPKKV
jgi:hypothetical protein